MIRKKIEQDNIAFFIGIFFTFLVFVPLFILGENDIVPIHDQLDGVVLDYILCAKHFGSTNFLELMNETAAVTPISPGTVLFYVLFDPFWAFLLNWVFVSLAAFVGMFFCLQELFQRPWLSLIVSVLFSQLPFYSTQGLSAMGEPLLVLFCIRVYKEKSNNLDFLLIVFLTIFSSPVYGGYASCLFMGIFVLFLFYKKHPKRKIALLGFVMLVALYSLLNLHLIFDMLLPNARISNRAEHVATSLSAKDAFIQMLENGQYHAVSLHYNILKAVLICLLICLLFFAHHSQKQREHFIMFGIFIAVTIFIALFYAFFHSPEVVNIRNKLGGIFTSFQFDRFYFLYPSIWYLLLAYVLYFIFSIENKNEKIVKITQLFVTIFLVFNIGSSIYDASLIHMNMNKAFGVGESSGMSWNEFYSPDLFKEIDQYIGKDKSTYRTASIGLFPSIALYNGFYCIDGYSYNYDLSYKHEFRKIIEKELEKNNKMRSYFDDWGNRCYIFIDQIYGNYLITKDYEGVLNEASLNTNQMKKMGCEYIFSALPIESPLTPDITLLNDFVNEDSPYHIYLYQIGS